MSASAVARVVAFVLTAAWSELVAGSDACAGLPLSEVPSLAGLPKDVYELLGGGRAPENGVADRGKSFSRTDTNKDHLPSRRFVLAGVSSQCVVVALEHGGRSYRVERWVFRRTDSGWLGELQGKYKRPPKSLHELVHGASL